MALPIFEYHPDPIGTGSIVESDTRCECCEKVRGYIYTGPVYAAAELDDCICPWCISDGSAHEKFEAEFTDAAGVGDYVQPKTLTRDIVEEVAFRTPGFSGWQQERWLACCEDAAAFVGHAGYDEINSEWSDAIPSLQNDCGLEGDEWTEFFSHFDKNYGPTAYVFQCLHCNSLVAYQDCH